MVDKRLPITSVVAGPRSGDTRRSILLSRLHRLCRPVWGTAGATARQNVAFLPNRRMTMHHTTAKQKASPIPILADVWMYLILTTLTLQVVMTVNSIWGLLLRKISTMATAFT